MDKKEFLKGCGLAPPEDEVIEPELDDDLPEDKIIEIDVPKDKLKKVADKPPSAPEASDEEINRLRSKLSELEESQQQNGDDIREQLGNIHATVAGLEGTVKASTSIIQAEEIVNRLAELKSRLEEIDESLKLASCPECGALVGWDSQVREIPQTEFEELPAWSFSRMFDFGEPPMVKVRECPVCGHRVKVKEEEETEVKQPASEEKVVVIKGKENGIAPKTSGDDKGLFPFNFKT